MDVSIDFGGSTIDAARWSHDGKLLSVQTFERFPHLNHSDLQIFFESTALTLNGAQKVLVTGGRSSTFGSSYRGIPVVHVPEIEAIGRGGWYLFQHDERFKNQSFSGSLLVVSMGTGTCMVLVEVKDGEYVSSRHLGGTGVGGGTFLGLSKLLLGENDPAKLIPMFQKGSSSAVDLSVFDIVGGGIGVVPADATASNLGKLARDTGYTKDDLAAGIANLIGQTIGITSTFAAMGHGAKTVLLTGKLTAMEGIVRLVQHTGELYGVSMAVPEKSAFVSAVGAGCQF